MDDYTHLKNDLEHQKQLTRELLSGIINVQWLILELLDRENILPKEKALTALREALTDLEPDLSESPDALPLRHLIWALSGPHAGARRRGWTPMVLPGGKDDASRGPKAPPEPPDPHGDR